MQLLSVLLGGTITLVVTAVVQIFVIPAVQRRTRALERWEKDVIELMTLVNEETSDKLTMVKNICEDDLPEAMIRAALLSKQQPNSDEPVLIVSRAWGYAEKSWDEAHDLSTRILKTLGRCALLHRRSAYWSVFFNEVQAFRSCLLELYKSANDFQAFDRERLDGALSDLLEAHDGLSKRLQEITEPIRPPKQRSRWDGWRARRQLEKAKK